MIIDLNLNSNSPNFNLPYRRWKEKEFIEEIIFELVKKEEDFRKVKIKIKNFLESKTIPFITCIKFFLRKKGILE